MNLIQRSAQQIIAGFPSHIAIAGDQFGLDGILIVQPGVKGYWPSKTKTLAEADDQLLRVFGARAPTEAEREAAAIGSLVGWDVPGADPLNHPIKDETLA
jgi:hypothetical protein